MPRKGKIVQAEPARTLGCGVLLLSLGIILVRIGLGFGLMKVNTDPSLPDYFRPKQELRDGLDLSIARDAAIRLSSSSSRQTATA